MKYFLTLLLLTAGCSRSAQSYGSDHYKKHCQKVCQEDFGTDVDGVGILTGKCFCK